MLMTPAESNPPTSLVSDANIITEEAEYTEVAADRGEQWAIDKQAAEKQADDGVDYDGGMREALEQDQAFAEAEPQPEPAKPTLMRSKVLEPLPDKAAEAEKMMAELEQQNEPAETGLTTKVEQGIRQSNDPKTLLQWGTILHQSGVFPIVKSPQDAVARILMARSLQVDEMKAMYMLHMIDGKPVLSADLMRFLLDRAGVRYKVIENRAYYMNPALANREHPEGQPDFRTKIRMKQDSTGKDVLWDIWWSDCAPFRATNAKTWEKFPKDMQLHACMRKCARFYFPAILGGVYDPDEMGLEDAHNTFAEEAN